MRRKMFSKEMNMSYLDSALAFKQLNDSSDTSSAWDTIGVELTHVLVNEPTASLENILEMEGFVYIQETFIRT